MRMIDKTYGHLALDSEESLRARLDARAGAARAEGTTLTDDTISTS